MSKLEVIRNVYPGEIITESGQKCLGINNGVAVVAGQLCKIEDLYFIRSKTDRYQPTKYDIVIGKISIVTQDYFKVDLMNGVIGYLPALSFANATKRNRPDLQKEDFVMCQVTRTGTDPLLCCKLEGLGKIDEIYKVQPWKIRYLYFSDHLTELGKTKEFKIALAMNGFVWIEADPGIKREILKIIYEIK